MAVIDRDEPILLNHVVRSDAIVVALAVQDIDEQPAEAKVRKDRGFICVFFIFFAAMTSVFGVVLKDLVHEVQVKNDFVEMPCQVLNVSVSYPCTRQECDCTCGWCGAEFLLVQIQTPNLFNFNVSINVYTYESAHCQGSTKTAFPTYQEMLKDATSLYKIDQEISCWKNSKGQWTVHEPVVYPGKYVGVSVSGIASLLFLIRICYMIKKRS